MEDGCIMVHDRLLVLLQLFRAFSVIKVMNIISVMSFCLKFSCVRRQLLVSDQQIQALELGPHWLHGLNC